MLQRSFPSVPALFIGGSAIRLPAPASAQGQNKPAKTLASQRAASLKSLIPEFIKQAQTITAEISDARTKASDLWQIAKVQAQSGDVAGAKQTLAGITEGKLRDLALVSIALEKGGNIADARMAAEQITDAETKEIALVSIGKAQARRGDMAGANQTFLSAQQAVEKITTRLKVYALLRIVRAIDDVVRSK